MLTSFCFGLFVFSFFANDHRFGNALLSINLSFHPVLELMRTQYFSTHRFEQLKKNYMAEMSNKDKEIKQMEIRYWAEKS